MPLRKNKKKCYDIFANLNIIRIKFLSFFLKKMHASTQKNIHAYCLNFVLKLTKLRCSYKVISERLKPVVVVLKLKSC